MSDRGDHGKVGVGEHRSGDVAVPGVVAADLVLVEPDLVLRGLEALLDGLPGAGDPDEAFIAGAWRAGAQVVGQFGLLACMDLRRSSRSAVAVNASPPGSDPTSVGGRGDPSG